MPDLSDETLPAGIRGVEMTPTETIGIPESWFVCRLCRWRMADKPDAVQKRCKHEWTWAL